jgi:ribosome biogenesis protein NSA1
MRLLTGDECGLLKEIIPEIGRKKKGPNDIVAPYNAMADVIKEGVFRVDPKESQKRNRGVVDMVWIDEGDGSTESDDGDGSSSSSFSVLRKNGSVDLWTANIDNKKTFGQHTLEYSTDNNIFGGDGDNPRPLGLGFFHQHNKLCAGDMLGNIVILDLKNKNKKCNVIQTYNAYTANKSNTTISYTPGNLENSQLATCIAFDTANARAAVGGREREVCLVDILTGKQVFKTKNLSPDPQTLLQQPVWPSAIQFLNNDCNIMAVGTAYKQVRLYDVRENTKTRRPTSLTPEGLFEYRLTSLCQIDEHEIVIGDTSGNIQSLDIRKMGRESKCKANRDMGRYAGPVGSIRQLKKHPTLPRLAAVGLDRMLRVYDTNKRRQLDCVYLKQRLNCVLFHKNHIWDSTGDTGAISDDDDDDLDIDDGDIDQDDEVRDYVDSDGSDNEDANMKSESKIKDSSEPAGVEEEDDDDDSNSDDSVEIENESDDDDDESSEEEESSEKDKDDEETEESEEEETIIITQESKRRRRR